MFDIVLKKYKVYISHNDWRAQIKYFVHAQMPCFSSFTGNFNIFTGFLLLISYFKSNLMQ